MAAVIGVGEVLVTGANGFVGSRLVSRLLADNPARPVRSVTRSPEATLPTGATRWVIPDFVAPDAWGDALAGVEVVFHLAARVHMIGRTGPETLDEYRRSNVEGTVALARSAAAAGVGRFVFVSSVKVNGEEGFFRETDAPTPSDAYGQSKAEAEAALRAIAARSAMAVSIVRPPLVYGPGVRANFAALIRVVANGVPLPLGMVENRRSLVALDNLVDFLCCCAGHPSARNETFFVNDGEDLSTPELIRRIAHALGRDARLWPMPSPVLVGLATLTGRRAWIARLLGSLQTDLSKSRTLLGWTPPLSVDEGLRLAVADWQSGGAGAGDGRPRS